MLYRTQSASNPLDPTPGTGGGTPGSVGVTPNTGGSYAIILPDLVNSAMKAVAWDSIGASAATWANVIANRLEALYGLPCAILNHGVGGSSLLEANWISGGSYRAECIRLIKRYGVGMVLLQHGTNLNLQTPAQVATFGASMADLVSDLRTQSGKAALPFIVDMAPPDPRAGATTGGSTFAVNSVSARRQTVDYINSGVTAVYAGTQLYDVQRENSTFSGVHPKNDSYSGYGRLADHEFVAMAAVLQGQAPPRFRATAAAGVSGTQTRITVSQAAGTDFTPSTDIRNWIVSANDDLSSPYAISAAVREDATHILLTHADRGVTSVKAFYGEHATAGVPATSADLSNLTNSVRDNSTFALPLEQTSKGLAVA
jgi:hypothetical protein